ncbi:MAG: hypothetical protein JSS20_00785 [Proteobacteria bacterium]|nr:hypothetical protein [Pseudomonadota bacterium]
MRVLVLVLVLLAAAKIGAQYYLVSSAKNEIIVGAYRERAIGACGQTARTQHVDVKPTWADNSDVRLVIGKSSLDVQLWQFDNRLWAARYKNPYLFLTMRDDAQKVFCEFDIVQGSATVLRM